MIKRLKEYDGIRCHWDKDRICENSLFCGMCEFQPADDDKPNGRKDPVPIRWENDYGMMTPYCPSCGEMAYSTERCVFCGQRLLPIENPRKNVTEITGGHADDDGNLRCDECGSDELLLVSHEDGATFYGYTYKCAKCGSRISSRTKLIGSRW